MEDIIIYLSLSIRKLKQFRVYTLNVKLQLGAYYYFSVGLQQKDWELGNSLALIAGSCFIILHKNGIFNGTQLLETTWLHIN